MKDLRFSIVIPTRERAGTLKYCLKTCVEQQLFDNYEIIVSDNNSSAETREVVESFHCDKLKYFSTGSTLAMHENFEFAVQHAKGEYIIFLGDDDGLLLRALYQLDRVIKKTGFKAIAWQWIFYYWPEGVPAGVENIMYIPTSEGIKVVDGKESVREVAQFKKHYSQLPMLYINGAIHRDLVTDLKTKTGGVFRSVTPDCYSAICLAYLSGQYLFLDRPITIAGISGKSNGNNHLYKKWNNEISNEYNSLNIQSTIHFHKSVPFVRSLNAVVAEAFIQAKERLFPNDDQVVLDRKVMIANILNDLVVFENEEWEFFIKVIRESIKYEADLELYFEERLKNYELQITDVARKQTVSTGINYFTLILNGSTFDCKNVYDVALFYNKFLDSDLKIPENIKFEQTLAPEPARLNLLKGAVRRVKLAARVIIKGY